MTANNPQLSYASHLVQNVHEYDTTTLPLNINKGLYMNNLAQFHVQQYSFPNKLIAEK